MSQTLDSLVVELRADIKGLQASLQTAAGDVQRFNNTASAGLNGFQGAIGRARVAILSLGVAWAAFRLGKGVIDAGMQMQALQNRFIAATGDARVAADGLAFVREESERLGLSFQDTAASFAAFSASALRSGLTLQQTKDVFSSVAEATTALHLAPEQATSAFLALEQMASKGTVQMQELKLQLSQAIPGAFEIMAKAMNVSVAQLNKMMETGNLLSSDALPKLGEELHRQFGGVAVQAADSAQAAFNRLNNAFFDLQTKMADSGFLDVVTTAVKDLTAALNDPATIDGLKGFAELMGEAAKAALLVTSAVGKANNAINSVADKGAGLFGKRFADEVALVKRQAASGLGEDSQKLIDRITAQGGIKFAPVAMGDTGGLSSEGAFPGGPAPVSGSYSLGKTMMPAASADAKGEKARLAAEKQAAQLRDQMQNQVAAFSYNRADPEDKAALDVENQQKMLKQALDAKAITEQEYRDLSLQAETDYQEQLAEIRQKAWEYDQSGLEAFLDIRLQTQDQLRNQSLSDQAKGFRSTIAQAAQHNAVFFAMEKAAALARATLAAYESVVSAYAFGSRIGGPILGAAFAGVAAAAQAVNIAAIASTSFNGGGSTVSASGSPGGGGYTGSTDTGSGGSAAPTKIMQITLVGSETSQMSKNQVRELIDLINDAQKDGSRVQVVNA